MYLHTYTYLLVYISSAIPPPSFLFIRELSEEKKAPKPQKRKKKKERKKKEKSEVELV